MDHSQHNTVFYKRLLAGTTAVAAVVASPHVLPSLGIGNAEMAKQVLGWCEKAGTTAGGVATGSGIAGALNTGLGSVPVIGDTLARAGLGSALISGTIGLGGNLLGNYIEKHYDKPGHIPWGKIIRYATLATSILIALPSILSGISMGLTYLGLVIGGGGVGGSIFGATSATLGMMGGMSSAISLSGFTSILPHLVTCGLAALPAVGSLFLGSSNPYGTPSNTIEAPKSPVVERVIRQAPPLTTAAL